MFSEITENMLARMKQLEELDGRFDSLIVPIGTSALVCRRKM